MIVESHLKPNSYRIRMKEGGRLYVLLRGDVVQEDIANEDGSTDTRYIYNEYEITTAPRSDIDSYLSNNIETLYTQAKERQRQKEAEERKHKIDQELDAIDKAAIRSIRAAQMAEQNGKPPNTKDIDRLEILEDAAQSLRDQRSGTGEISWPKWRKS